MSRSKGLVQSNTLVMCKILNPPQHHTLPYMWVHRSQNFKKYRFKNEPTLAVAVHFCNPASGRLRRRAGCESEVSIRLRFNQITGWECSLQVEHLPSICRTMDLMHNTENKQTNQKRTKNNNQSEQTHTEG